MVARELALVDGLEVTQQVSKGSLKHVVLLILRNQGWLISPFVCRRSPKHIRWTAAGVMCLAFAIVS